MAARCYRLTLFSLILILLEIRIRCAFATKCTIKLNETQYAVTDWTWEYRTSRDVSYKLNLCSPLKCEHQDTGVCRTTSGSEKILGLASKRAVVLAADHTGFSLTYTGTKDGCEKSASGDWHARIVMKCGKFMGSPVLVEEFVNDKGCWVVFEFVTNEACKTPPKTSEIPCTIYLKDGQRRDLTPLIKLQGGYEVASQDENYDYHINVCRGITPETGGHTQSCPDGSSSCRVEPKLSKSIGMGEIASNTSLQAGASNEIILKYEVKDPVLCRMNLKIKPVTTITFMCPKELHQSGARGPVMTSDKDCQLQILWETEFACPVDKALQNNSGCVLRNDFVNFDLTVLAAPALSNYKVNATDAHGTTYWYYINVCKSTNLQCAPSGTNAAVCQERADHPGAKSLGDIRQTSLRYADGQLVLTYKGGATCSQGLNRSTIITFKCNVHAGKGHPVFSYEDYCFYFFDWETKYACPPSRRTGSRCRVSNSKGVRYDLSELVRRDTSRNWLAIDGESAGSSRAILINVCESLVFNNRSRRCRIAASICIEDGDSAKSLGRYTDSPTLNPDGSIKLVYTMGDQCKVAPDGKQVFIQSSIVFVCHPGDLESPPVLVGKSQDGCVYDFMWRTAAACPLGVNSGDNCKVQDTEAGYVFDLNALASAGLFTAEDDKYKFELMVCNSANTTCGPDAGACQYDKSDKKQHWNMGQPSNKLAYYDGMLDLTYSDGDTCRARHPADQPPARQTQITFLCKPGAGLGQPEYEKEDGCHYSFRWFTQYACPAKTMECAARSGGDQYDLASLVKTQDNWSTFDKDQGTFFINVCRSLNLGPLVKGCSGTAAVCLSNGNTFVNLGQVSESVQVVQKGIVVIRYSNGDNCGVGKYSAEIKFICKSGSAESGPRYKGTENKCKYLFEWESPAACAIENKVGDHCSVRDPKSDTVFNLYPLRKVYRVNATGRHFLLKICGALTKGTCTADSADAGACEVAGSKKIVLGKSNQKLAFESEILVLTYSDGGRYEPNGRSREVKVRFYCNPRIPFGEPRFTEQQAQVYFFEVQTSLACAAQAVQCRVTGSRNRTFDLTPLGRDKGNWEAVDSRANNKHLHYFINVCRPYNPPGQGITCPGGAIGGCQYDHKLGRGHNMGYIQSNPQVAANGDLVLRYLGGDTCHNRFNRSTRILFYCSKTMGSPTFVSESQECEYLFTWKTPSACALTRETGNNCTVVDKQYDYEFDLTTLTNGTTGYKVAVSNEEGSYILLNGCGKLHSELNSCEGKGVCIVTKANLAGTGLAVNTTLAYYAGEISMKFTGAKYSVQVSFMCDQEAGLASGPSQCDKAGDSSYTCSWPSPLLCRPAAHAQCSIRVESNDKADHQYDFTRLAMSDGNWKARTTDARSVDYYINVCRSLVPKGDAGRCPPTAGACKVEENNGKKTYMSLGTMRRGPQLGNSSSSLTDNIYLLYEGGDPCDNGVMARAHVQMECGSDGQGAPIFVSMSKINCRFEFLWITDIACPINDQGASTSGDCTAVNPQTNVLFDLKPLKRTGGNDYSVRDTAGHSYEMNVCAPVIGGKGKACGSKSGICQLSATPSFHKNAGNANDALSFSGGVLALNYSGGDHCHHSDTDRQTIISFVCNSTRGAGHGSPVFVTETDDCTYYIDWHTNLACEREMECVAFSTSNGEANVKYSLKSLMRHDRNWLVVPAQESSKDSFYINMCRPLVPMKGVKCPAGAFACRRTSSGQLQSLGRIANPPSVGPDGAITIEYENGSKCNEPGDPFLRTVIKLTCAQGTQGKPVFLGKALSNCTYIFTWATSAACPMGVEIVDRAKCRVYDNATDHWYDLRALQSDEKSLHYKTVTGADGTEFFVSVCRGVGIDGCGDAAVCAKKAGKVTPLGQANFRNLTYYHGERMLILKYCSTRSCDPTGIVSKITFICDEKALNREPTLQAHDNKGAEFVWRTNLVCPPVQRECAYTHDGKTYDLQLLSSRSKSWIYTTYTKEKFWINICRGIHNGPAGCPPTASVCQESPGSKEIKVLGYVNTQTFASDGSNLLLSYDGKRDPNCAAQIEKVEFQFKCGQHVGQPRFSVKKDPCTFVFEWKTVAACDTERKKITERDCQVVHPLTGQNIDFSRLSPAGKFTNLAGTSKGKSFMFLVSLCNSRAPGTRDASLSRKQNGVTTPLKLKSRDFYYEDYVFELWLVTTEKCHENPKYFTTVILNFHCSVDVVKGKPVYQYESANCHHFITWPTSIVCPTDEGSVVVDPARPRAEISSKKTKTGVGIALGVLAGVAVLTLLVYLLYKPERRRNLAFKLRWHVRRYILCKESSMNVPSYRYQKINATDDDEADALLKEEGMESDLFDDDEDDDEDLLADI